MHRIEVAPNTNRTIGDIVILKCLACGGCLIGAQQQDPSMRSTLAIRERLLDNWLTVRACPAQ
jgi:hypothetical protein